MDRASPLCPLGCIIRTFGNSVALGRNFMKSTVRLQIWYCLWKKSKETEAIITGEPRMEEEKKEITGCKEKNLKGKDGGWRDGFMTKNTFDSCRRPGFSPQQPY